MGIEWVVGIGVAGILLGVLIGYFLPQGGAKKARVAELETALETAQEELQDYKTEVFGQFSETAEKFRALDKSYNDLHRQLAQSSVALCGDAATPLLENQEASEQAIEVTPDASADNAAENSGEEETIVVAESELDADTQESVDADFSDTSVVSESSQEGEASEQASEMVAEQSPAEETAASDTSEQVSDIEVDLNATAEETVPTLTEVDANKKQESV